MGKNLEGGSISEILTRNFLRETGGDREKNSVRIFGVQGEVGFKHLSNRISDIRATSVNLCIVT
jgi:hypothetical protein